MPSDHRFSNSNMFIISEDPTFTELVRLYLVNNGFRKLYVFNNLIDAAETLSLFPAELLITSSSSMQFQKNSVTKIARKHPILSQTPVVAVDLTHGHQPSNLPLHDNDYPVSIRLSSRQNLIETLSELLERRASTMRKHHMQETESSGRKAHTAFAEQEKSLRRAFDRSC